MSRILASVGVLVLIVTCATGVHAGRQSVTIAGSTVVVQRDPAATLTATTRTVPVGTAAIAGTVTAAATGRPLSNVRLLLSGNSEVPAPSRAGAPGPFGGTAIPTLSLSRTTMSDEQGRFIFEALPRGRFTLTATRDQYLSAAYGATKPTRPGTAIPLVDGQHMSVAMAMIRGGVIAGTVYGQDGDPLVNTQIFAKRLAYANGVKRLVSGGFAQTDDRGMYRVTNLQPGQYFVSAVPNFGSFPNADQIRSESEAFRTALDAARQGGRSPSTITFGVVSPQGGAQPGFVGTYYPSTGSTASAQSVIVAGGDEHSGMDIVALAIRASMVSGLVAGMPEPPLNVQVSLVNVDPSADGGQQGTRTRPDGSFMFPNVVPGTYTLVAQVVPAPNIVLAGGSGGGGGQIPTVDPAQRYWGRGSIVVDGQTMPQVVIGLQPPRSISGTVIYQGGGPGRGSGPVAFQGGGPGRGSAVVQLAPDPASPTLNIGSPLQATVGADGQFTIGGVGAGSYLLRAGGGRAKSAILNGQDLLDFPLAFDGDKDVTGIEITLINQPSRLTGTLTEASGVAASAYTIIVGASDHRYWTPSSRRILTTRPDLDGHFTFTGLPAGDYMLAAVTDLEPGQQFDPEFLSDLSSASVPVTVMEGGEQVRDIRINR